MLLVSCLSSAFVRGAPALVFALMTGLGVAQRADAVTVTGLYEATVPLADRSERGQSEALQDAMRQVLVRVTGQRNAAYEPALTQLVDDARRYVQQFRVVGSDQFFAGFDGVKLERLIVDAGQPVWGQERPSTLVWLEPVDPAGRPVSDERSLAALRSPLDRAAALRGLPVIWPAAARSRESAVTSDASSERLSTLAEEHAVDAVLLGRASQSPAGSWRVRWTLFYGGERSEWSGPPEEGAHGAADVFAGVFAAGTAQADSAVTISVSGVSSLGAYAQVTDYLESLSLIRALAVEELSGDVVVYRADVRGGASRLARAIDLGKRLEPASSSTDPAIGASLSYRFRP
jgi:hypothetical protein